MKRYIALLIISSTLHGCHHSAEGDIVAVVNGDEITRNELNAALPQAPAGSDAMLVRNAALDRLVNERLMVQAARKDGLDKSQDYIVKSHSAENLILSSMFIRQTMGKIQSVSRE